MRRLLHATLALALGCSVTAAEAQRARACVTEDEAADLVLALAPDLLLAVGGSCGPSLPPSALLRQGVTGPFGAKYRAAADAGWARARGAIAKVAGPELQGLIGSDLARPMLATLIVPTLVKDIKPADCPQIEKVLSLLAPLPPENTARLVVTAVQLGQKGKKDALPICPAAPVR